MALDLSTHLILPGWVFLFRSGLPIESDGSRIFLAPSLDDNERQAFYFLLDHVIHQVLLSNSTHLTFDFKKMEGLPEKVWKRLSTLFLQLQLTSFPDAKTVKFFEKERWTYEPSRDAEHPRLECSIREEALGLLLNYFSPLSATPDEMGSAQAFMSSPAVFARSLWLDCSPKERDVLFAFERQLHEAHACLHLDGYFEISYDEISRYAKCSSVEKEWEFLDRFSRKIRDHGWAVLPSDSVLFLRGSDENTGPSVAWKVAPQLITHPLTDAFEVSVARFYFKRDLSNDVTRSKYLDYLTWGIHTPSEMNFVHHAVEKLTQTSNTGIPLKTGSVLWDLRLMFLEWTQRQKPGHRFPIPQVWRDAAAFKITSQVTPADLESTFETFSHALQADIDFVRAATKTTELFNFKEFTKEPESVPYQVQPIAAAEPTKVPEKKEPQLFDKNQLLKTKLRKMATDELEKIQRESPEDYIQLKKKFFDSLDEQSRSLMRGVQDRMQPTLFEQHIKARLISFMVDHPALWQFVSKSPMAQSPITSALLRERAAATDQQSRSS